MPLSEEDEKSRSIMTYATELKTECGAKNDRKKSHPPERHANSVWQAIPWLLHQQYPHSGDRSRNEVAGYETKRNDSAWSVTKIKANTQMHDGHRHTG